MQSKIDKAKQFIKDANAIIITAGAGMSVDSGLPDFRGDDGFYKAYPPLKDKKINFFNITTPKWFLTEPKLAWAFYAQALKLYANAVPHKGYELLKNLCKSKNDNYFIYTSNVDGHFAKTGFNRDKIYECHGCIHKAQCIYDENGEIWDICKDDIEIDEINFVATKMPVCKECGCASRPNVLMFYDSEFNWAIHKEQYKRYQEWLSKNMNSRFVIIEIGAGLTVPTIRDFGEKFVRRFNKSSLIRINPIDDAISEDLGVSIGLGGLEALEKILLDKKS